MLDENGFEILTSPVYDEEGNRLTEWDEANGWVEFNGVEQTESGAWVQSGVYHPYTDEELAEREEAENEPSPEDYEARIAALEEELVATKILLGVE